MAWLTPKINWAVQPYVNGRYNGDWFNIADYNRIKGNIEFVYPLITTVYTNVPAMVSMPSISISGYPYASVLNSLETNVYQLATGTGIVSGYQRKTYQSNGKTPTYNDWNRIESALLALYNEITNITILTPILDFTLGGVQF